MYDMHGAVPLNTLVIHAIYHWLKHLLTTPLCIASYTHMVGVTDTCIGTDMDKARVPAISDGMVRIHGLSHMHTGNPYVYGMTVCIWDSPYIYGQNTCMGWNIFIKKQGKQQWLIASKRQINIQILTLKCYICKCYSSQGY